jgi:hypothetical protein
VLPTFVLGILSIFAIPALASVPQESQLSEIQALLWDSKFPDVLARLSVLPQVQQRVEDLSEDEPHDLKLAPTQDSLMSRVALQYLHQLCLDIAAHAPHRVIHSCFSYVVQQDQARSAQ